MKDDERQRAYRSPALTVWRYDTPLGADAGAVRLKSLQERDALTVHDAITVAWMPGAHQPRIGHLRHTTAGAAGKGSVLGALIGTLVLAPAVGAAAGAGVAALAQRLRGTGIDQQFLEEVIGHLEPGSSALLVLTSDADLDHVRPVVERGIARGDVVLLHARLAEDAPAALRAVVADLAPRDASDPREGESR
ncbi:DUF1269 domain-containing protein [Nocardioides lianchengensis]|uniref:Uncharacterized membrane protein n=1 Tax=Nocardioides lianchengensis TaxID=1045774 RepID=A0A1G6W523_9ACTN|nr:DUF1269 domain-containing protein [Nocardioides lianchengensis]NYG09460.1 putative membrane protein [Nocardioides lianchengensis]SDD60126.1 Uncharacterized membrane protein [Nocardioides lianchengensis]